MTTEENDFDVGEFFDEGVKDAELNPQEAVTDSPKEQDQAGVMSKVEKETAEPEPEPTPEKKGEPKGETPDETSEEDVEAALKSTEQAEPEPESIIDTLLPTPKPRAKAEQTGQRVPLDEHIKLRQRAQAAERERDELKKQLESAPTGGEKPGLAEQSPLEKYVEENPEEDFVPAKVQLEERKWQEAKAKAEQTAADEARKAELDAADAEQRTIQQINALKEKAAESERAARNAHEDYDTVTKPIVEAKMLSREELIDIFKAAKPGEQLYQVCRAKANVLRNIVQPTEKPADTKTGTKGDAKKTEDTDDLTDDEIFDAVYKD